MFKLKEEKNDSNPKDDWGCPREEGTMDNSFVPLWLNNSMSVASK
jgi:hypothetical protein